MRRIAVLGVSLCTLGIGSLDAEAGAWCAYYDSYTYNCGFRTFDQCRATISGESRAWCSPNPAGGYEEPRRPLRRRQEKSPAGFPAGLQLAVSSLGSRVRRG
jgi:Protein of unknown function (DUF3551)